MESRDNLRVNKQEPDNTLDFLYTFIKSFNLKKTSRGVSADAPVLIRPISKPPVLLRTKYFSFQSLVSLVAVNNKSGINFFLESYSIWQLYSLHVCSHSLLKYSLSKLKVSKRLYPLT